MLLSHMSTATWDQFQVKLKEGGEADKSFQKQKIRTTFTELDLYFPKEFKKNEW